MTAIPSEKSEQANLKSRRDLTIIATDEIGGKIKYNTNHEMVEPLSGFFVPFFTPMISS